MLPRRYRQPTIVCLEADLFFAPRLQDVILARGGRPVIVDTPAEFVDAVDRHFPVLGLIDLATPGDRAAAIAAASCSPTRRTCPSSPLAAMWMWRRSKAARKAGADHAWARSKLMEELVAVVDRYLQPPVRYPAGWDEPLSDLARAGIELFNQGEYFEQHELLEQAWLAEPRPIREMYQGILQVGVAFLQLERQNWPGAIKLLRRACRACATCRPSARGCASTSSGPPRRRFMPR